MLLYLILWMSVILTIGILPLSNFVGHSHWEYIKWVPSAVDLRSPEYLLDIGTDFIANTMLFVPFGFFLSRLLGSYPLSRRFIVVAAVGGCLSLSIELYQVYCHNRFPSIFDVVTNVSGALLGVYLSVSRPSLLGSAHDSMITPIPPGHTPVP